MPAQTFARIAAFIFAIVAIAQIARVVFSFDIVVAGTTIPTVASIGIAVVAGLLSVLGLTAR